MPSSLFQKSSGNSLLDAVNALKGMGGNPHRQRCEGPGASAARQRDGSRGRPRRDGVVRPPGRAPLPSSEKTMGANRGVGGAARGGLRHRGGAGGLAGPRKTSLHEGVLQWLTLES